MENNNTKKILPKLTELPNQTLGFINSQGFINSFNDHAKLQDLSMEIDSKCTHLQNHLNYLHTTLSSLLVSSISHSIRSKSSLDDLIVNLENLSIISSYYGNRVERRNVEKMVDNDLGYIARELRRIDNIRQYAEAGVKLEALVGDLEDAALSALSRHTGHTFSRSRQNSSIPGDLNGSLSNVHWAVKAINGIEEVLLDVMKAHPQWSNLLKTVDGRVDKILSRLRPQVIADHRSLLASLGWPPKLVTTSMQTGDATGIPNPLVLMKGEKKESYSQSFLALCALQHVHLRREERHRLILGQKKQTNFRLWAIDELVTPIASKIEHHLSKWTSQPELMFALVYKVTRDFIQGVDDVLQPLIDRARLLSCSAKEAWVSAMVQVLSNFLAKNMFPVFAVRYRDKSTQSDVISSWLNLIDHIVKFDKQMQSFVSSETYLFMAGPSIELVRSMSALSLFCDRPDWLHIWAKVELKDAWNKLKAELKDEKAWSSGRKLGNSRNIEKGIEQYCLSTGEDHKAPQVAEFVLKTTGELIQRCQTLPGTARRIQFIKSAPVKFLWQFVKILLARHSSTEFPTYDVEETLIRVCQLVNAARFSEFKLREWSDDVDILELTLVEMGNDTNSLFFHEEVESLIEMETNWLMEIITHILRHFQDASSCYFHDMREFELTLSASNDNLFVSSDLVVGLDNLRDMLLLVKEHLNATDFLDTWRNVAEGLDHYIFHSIMSANIRFSEEGAKQFTTDIEGLFLVFKAFCSRPDAFFPNIRDFLKLLRLGKEEVTGLQSTLLDSAKCSDCLLSHGISSLSFDQALKILNSIIFSA
ncbi:RINT1-like protein MAG2L [Silene latifolia]|uniref:RINT1-like protein MAG2L n=1 Tax=Silene latifolia TaxID=37657 RepID=UPI003D78145D